MQSPVSSVLSKTNSCAEMNLNLRRNTLEGKRSNQENQNIIVSYRQLSQAYDNAQQKILDLQEQSRIDQKTIEQGKQKLNLYEQLSTQQNLEEILAQLKKLNLNESFLLEWTETQNQMQQLVCENSVLKQQSHQFLQLNTKLGEVNNSFLGQDLKNCYQELTDANSDIQEKEAQFEEIVEYVEQLKSQLLERDDQKTFLLQELSSSKENNTKGESVITKLRNKKKQYKSQISTLKLDVERMHNQMNTLQKNHTEEESKLKKTIEELNTFTRNLEQTKATMVSQQEADVLQQNLHKVYSDLSQSRTEIRHMKEELAQSINSNMRLKEDANQMDKKVSSMKQVIEQQSESLQQKDEDLREMQTHFDHLQSYCDQRDQEFEQLQQQCKKVTSLEQLSEQYEQHCSQLQGELQSYVQIINQYQEAMQSVMQTLHLEFSENMQDFSSQVQQELTNMLQKCERAQMLEQQNQQLKDKLDSSQKSLQKLKKEHDKFVTSIQKDHQVWSDSQAQVTTLKDENAKLRNQMQQAVINLEQQHRANQDYKRGNKKLEDLNRLSLDLIEKVSLCLGGDYLELLKEISEVQKLSIEKSTLNDPSAIADLKILDVRLQALLGELESLQSLDQKRLQYVQQLEKQNAQLKFELQTLKNENDMKDFQKRNGEQQSTHRTIQNKKQTNSIDKLEYFISSSATKKQEQRLPNQTTQSVINNLSIQLKSLD